MCGYKQVRVGKMNVKEEDVFLLVLDHRLRREAKNYELSYAQIALACVDATKEIMSVAKKMSKSDLGREY